MKVAIPSLKKRHIRRVPYTEQSASAIKNTKRPPVRRNTPVLGLSIVLLVGYLVLCLSVFDTAMQYRIQQLLGGGLSKLFVVLLAIVILGFGLELRRVSLKKHRWAAWLLLVLPAFLLLGAELFWHSGGWNWIGSSLLWTTAFPCLTGVAFAVLLSAAFSQKREVKIASAAALAICIFFGGVTLAQKFGQQP